MLALLPVLLAGLTAGLTLPTRAEAQAIGGEVHGSVYALIRGSEAFVKDQTFGNPNIFLPDISVHLENVATSAASPAAITDLDGTFIVPAQPQAVYRLCWKAPGYVPGCAAKTFILRSANVNLLPVGVQAEPGVIYGRATLNDKTACRFVATFLGANIATTVTATLASNEVRSVHANNYGEYVLPALPNGSTKITAHCEAAEVSNVRTMAGATLVENLTLPNAKPNVHLAYATAGGRAVGAVAPGTTVQATVQVTDGGGFPLHYRWAAYPAAAGFVSQDAPTVDWKVTGSGLATIYVWAGDGHGGNVLNRVTLSTAPDRITFSGRVTANDAPFVAGAKVTINGKSTATNVRGDFLVVLPKEEPRYVVTIEKLGYQLLSRALYAPAVAATFELYRAQDFVVDPKKPIQITEKPSQTREQTGMQIVIPANSLAAGADGKGKLAQNPLHIQPASYNLLDPNNQIPGDYGGIGKTGNGLRLSTFGAGDVAIHDAAGNPYNLAPGKTAIVRLPIDPAQLAVAPATIPFWHYDTKLGMWRQDGTAKRVGNMYEAKATHLSAVNMDLAFADGACTRVVVDTGIMPVPFKIRMTPLTGGPVSPDHQNQVIDRALNVVVREPANIDVKYEMIDSANNVIAGATQTVHTGASSPSGTMWNPAANPPYLDCTSEVQYNEHTVQGLFPAAPGFLSFRTPPAYLDPAQAPALAAAYYAAIDPGGTKTTAGNVNDFTNWKTINGFNRPGVTHVVYENDYDLGFGRDMFMQKGGQDGLCGNCIAYYVTNYATVEDAVNHLNTKATVAMEYSPQNGVSGTPYTKFYIFDTVDGSPTNGAILPSVALDDFGPKFVPTLCIICHNGNVNSMGPDGNLTKARFIPFDLESYRYFSNNPADPQSQNQQEPAFKELNKQIMLLTNASAPVQLLIQHWYGAEGDPNLPNALFNAAAVPGQWTSPTDESTLYNAVVKPSCRSCHTTRDPADAGQDISWQSYDSLNQQGPIAKFRACTAPANAPGHHIMPQAERTLARFWLSTNPNGPVTIATSSLQGFQPPNVTNCQ